MHSAYKSSVSVDRLVNIRHVRWITTHLRYINHPRWQWYRLFVRKEKYNINRRDLGLRLGAHQRREASLRFTLAAWEYIYTGKEVDTMPTWTTSSRALISSSQSLLPHCQIFIMDHNAGKSHIFNGLYFLLNILLPDLFLSQRAFLRDAREKFSKFLSCCILFFWLIDARLLMLRCVIRWCGRVAADVLPPYTDLLPFVLYDFHTCGEPSLQSLILITR